MTPAAGLRIKATRRQPSPFLFTSITAAECNGRVLCSPPAAPLALPFVTDFISLRCVYLSCSCSIYFINQITIRGSNFQGSWCIAVHAPPAQLVLRGSLGTIRDHWQFLSEILRGECALCASLLLDHLHVLHLISQRLLSHALLVSLVIF